MRAWLFGEAEADVDGIMDAALRDGPQRIVREDGQVLIMVSEQEFQAAWASGQETEADTSRHPSYPPRPE